MTPPPRTQTKRARPTEPECSRTPLGEMKMPEPMMFPVGEMERHQPALWGSGCSMRTRTQAAPWRRREEGLEAWMSLGPSPPATPLWADHVRSLVPGMGVAPCPFSQAPLPEMAPVPLLSAHPPPTYSQEVGQARRLSHLSDGRGGPLLCIPTGPRSALGPQLRPPVFSSPQSPVLLPICWPKLAS